MDAYQSTHNPAELQEVSSLQEVPLRDCHLALKVTVTERGCSPVRGMTCSQFPATTQLRCRPDRQLSVCIICWRRGHLLILSSRAA